MLRFDCVEQPISRFFYNYGRYLAKNPLPFIVFPVLFTLAMAVGFLHMQPNTDAIYLFTPVGAQSKVERQAIHEKWPLSYDNYVAGRAVTQNREVQVIALARDDGNILEHHYAEAVFRLDRYIQKRVRVLYKHRYYSYHDLCLQYKNSGCPANKHVHVLSDLYNHGFNITFPYFRFGTEGGYLGGALGGVKLMKTENGTNILASAQAWFMIYHLKFFPTEISYISGLWENELGRHLAAYPEDPYIKITYFHSQTLADELRRNADSLLPRFVIAFILLVVFSMVCSIALIDNTYYIDWSLSKPILAILGVVNAGMGIVTSLGMLMLFGMPFSDIVSVMPFLVVAVGIDNMFLMIAAIRRTSRCLPVAERMGECMSDAAVAILITASTDALSFGVGAITTLPAVHIFCVYTGVAITFAFIYQITFFAALLVLFTKLEKNERNTVSGLNTVPETDMKIATWSQRLFNLGSRPDPVKGNDIKEAAIPGFFRDWYAPLLMNRVVRGIAIIWYIIYLIFAYYGVTQIKEGLEPINLLVEDSYAIPHYKLLQNYFWKYGATLQVVVNNAPDLRNSTSRQRIQAMIGDFATTRHSIGMEAVQFWMTDMDIYYRDTLDMKIIDGAFYSMLRHWLGSKQNNVWAEDLYWGEDEDGNVTLKSFRFLLGMRDISSTTDQMDATLLFREVAARWPEYNITTFMPLWLFTDQYAIIIPNTVQNIIIALACMVVIAFLLIPQPMCAFWVALACGSIDFGVVGYMTLWGVNLDAISMITIIMSIGFSVDYSAHITYGYVVSEALVPRDKVRDALASLGWPLCQGALSTIIAVSVLADVPAYMIITFFKTVFLSISIGLLHGLVFLPVLLSTFVRGCCFMDTNHKDAIEKMKVTPAIFKDTVTLEAGAKWPPSTINGMMTPSIQVFESPVVSYSSPSHVPIPMSEHSSAASIHNRSRASLKSPEHLE
ncbi:hypothetical protein V3C99_003564 [Haemonchus contortus]